MGNGGGRAMSRQPASNTDFVSKIYFFQKIKKLLTVRIIRAIINER